MKNIDRLGKLLLTGCLILFGSLALLFRVQEIRLAELRSSLRQLLEVRIDLAEGLVEAEMSGRKDSPFDQSLAEARLLQAIYRLKMLKLSDEREAARLRELLRSQDLLTSRLDLFRLNQKIRKREAELRRQVNDLARRQSLAFHWVLFGCLLAASASIHFLLASLKAQKGAVERAEEVALRFRQMAESVHEVFWIYDLPSAQYQYVGPGALDLWGHPPSELFKNPKAFRDSIHPDDQPFVRELNHRRLSVAVDEVYRIIKADGSTVWIRDRSFPMERGQLVGVVENVTSTRQIHRWLSSLLNQSRDLIFTVDQLGHCRFCSPACQRFFGEEFQLLERTLEPDRERLAQGLKEMSPLEYSITLKTLDGEELPLELVGAWVPEEEPPLAMIVGRDLRERISLQEKLLHSQKLEAVGRLAGGVAHDFNNLLSIIQGYVHLSMESQQPEEFLEEVDRACQAGARLVKQLLLFSRQQPSQKQPLDLAVVVSELEPLLQRALGSDHQLEVQLGAGQSHFIEADRSQLEQLLVNLVVNARDALTQPGEVHINLRSDTQEVHLEIQDTGEGMSAEQRERIFEPFFTTKELGKGSGLGLATVYGIVEQHRGRVVVESEPGKGSLFRFTFPRLDSSTPG
ncbi:PAS domain S-box protein [bacterium]|nr:PAS domain S-box protein [bacterium]